MHEHSATSICNWKMPEHIARPTWIRLENAGAYRSQGLYIQVYIKKYNVPVFNNGAKKHYLAWPLSNFHEFKSTYQQFITTSTCIELENVGGYRKAYMQKTKNAGAYRKALRIYSTVQTVSTYTACTCTPGRCSWASFKDRLRPLRFSIHFWNRVFCSDGFPYVLTLPFSTPAFSTPAVYSCFFHSWIFHSRSFIVPYLYAKFRIFVLRKCN